MPLKKRFTISILILLLCTGFGAYIYSLNQVELTRRNLPGFRAYIEPDQIDGRYPSIHLKLVNNTPYTVFPAQDIEVSTWNLFKKTPTGWQPFFENLTRSPCEVRWVRDGRYGIDEPLLPQKIKHYGISGCLGIRCSLESYKCFRESDGTYILQIFYTKQLSQSNVLLSTFTNPFTLQNPSLINQTIGITLHPELLEQNKDKVVAFTLTNQTTQTIFIRPFASTISAEYLYETPPFADMKLMRQVDENSWEYVDQPWTLLNNTKQFIEIEAGETYPLQGVDLDTEFKIETPGIYRWRIPVYMEVLTENEKLMLNKIRYVFSEDLEIK